MAAARLVLDAAHPAADDHDAGPVQDVGPVPLDGLDADHQPRQVPLGRCLCSRPDAKASTSAPAVKITAFAANTRQNNDIPKT